MSWLSEDSIHASYSLDWTSDIVSFSDIALTTVHIGKVLEIIRYDFSDIDDPYPPKKIGSHLHISFRYCLRRVWYQKEIYIFNDNLF